MIDFLTRLNPPTTPELVDGEIVLRPLRVVDYETWRDLRQSSRDHLTRFEDDWADDDVSKRAYLRRLAVTWRAIKSGNGYPLIAARRGDDALVGGATLHSIRMGASRSAILGYWVGAAYLRRGFGLAAVNAITRFGLETLELNRIVAACQPENEASKALLARAGYRNEGLARQYLRINGQWRDHEIFARTNRDFSH